MPDTTARPLPSPAPAPAQTTSRTLPDSAPESADAAACPTCAHPACRTQRAARQPILRGHRAEFAAEHRRAAAIQAHHPGLIVWFGETTRSYWAATPTGLIEAPDTDTLLLALWPHTHPRPLAGAERNGSSLRR